MLRFAQRSTLRAALALLAITNLLDAPPARSQHIGDVSLTTTTQVLANSVACTGNPQNFFPANIGQSFHLATAAIITGGTSFGMEIDGVDAVANVFKLSNPLITVGTQSFLVQGSGFMPIIRVTLTCTIGSTFSLSYSGSFAQNTINPGTPGTGGTVTTTGGYVQGIVPSGQNGAPIFPVIGGAVRPAINASTVQYGVDNLGISGFSAGNLQSGVFNMTPPVPTAAGEWGLAILANTLQGVVNSLLGPWSCATSSCITSSNSLPVAAFLNLGLNNRLSYQVTNGTGGISAFAQFILFSNIPTVRNAQSGNFGGSIGPNGVLAGSTFIFAATCSTLNCNLAPTSSQGNTLRLLGVNQFSSPGGGSQGLSVWIEGPTSAGNETITYNPAAGSTVTGSVIIELTGLQAGNLTTPSAALSASNPKFTPQEDDNGGIFTEAGGYDLTQTLTFSVAGTTTVPLWSQSQHGVLNTCLVSERVTNIAGAGTTLNTFLQDSADGVGFNDRVSMPQATTVAGAQNLLGAIPAFTGSALTAQANSAVVSTDGVLAAGSGIAGPLGPLGRMKFVVVGAAAAVTVTYNVACR